MKLGRKKKEEVTGGGFSKPALNEGKRSSVIIGLIVATVALIVFVLVMGHKAQETVQVAVLAQNVYKNQVITAEMLEPYDMLKAEYEKLAVVDADKIINSFAAYPLQQGMYAEYRNFVKSRIDNSDSVMYSYPGKEIIPLEVGQNELKTFKTFLQPGDKLNIEAVFTDKVVQKTDDGYGNIVNQTVEVVRSETVFNDIMIADLLNAEGQSILDIYASYNDKTVWQQAQMDSSESFQESTEPSSLLVALTPEEKDRYYYYKTKTDVQFKVSLPQRID